jgi:hypothetical protein
LKSGNWVRAIGKLKSAIGNRLIGNRAIGQSAISDYPMSLPIADYRLPIARSKSIADYRFPDENCPIAIADWPISISRLPMCVPLPISRLDIADK